LSSSSSSSLLEPADALPDWRFCSFCCDQLPLEPVVERWFWSPVALDDVLPELPCWVLVLSAPCCVVWLPEPMVCEVWLPLPMLELFCVPC